MRTNGMIAWNDALAPYIDVFAPGYVIRLGINGPFEYTNKGGETSMCKSEVATSRRSVG